MGGILVFAEQRDGEFRRVAFEAVSEARRLKERIGGPVAALLIGHNVGGLTETLGRYGAEKLYVADHEFLARYSGEAYRNIFLDAIERMKPSMIVVGSTAMGRDLVPRIAAKLGVPAAMEVTEIIVEDGVVRVKRPIQMGKIIATYRLRSEPYIIVIRPNTFPVEELEEPVSPAVEVIDASKHIEGVRDRVVDFVAAEKKMMDLTEAPVIVSGGRGLGGPEPFKMLWELAELLGGTVGASRAAVDAGWISHDHQVGLTGKIVSPNLYIAVGISGQIQHKVGCINSKVIVAINKDPEAPIFEFADYGIVGDLFEVVPRLIEEIKKLKQSKS